MCSSDLEGGSHTKLPRHRHPAQNSRDGSADGSRPGLVWADLGHQFRPTQRASGKISHAVGQPDNDKQENDGGKSMGHVAAKQHRSHQQGCRVKSTRGAPATTILGRNDRDGPDAKRNDRDSAGQPAEIHRCAAGQQRGNEAGRPVVAVHDVGPPGGVQRELRYRAREAGEAVRVVVPIAPVFVGEFGVPAPVTAESRAQFQAILDALATHRVPLAALWVYDFDGQARDWNVTPTNDRTWQLDAIQQVNEAWERVVDSDVRYRFVIDTASLNA